MWGVVRLLAVVPDTHRGICKEGGLPRGRVNEQVFSLQLVGLKQTMSGGAHNFVNTYLHLGFVPEPASPRLFHEGSRSGLEDHCGNQRDEDVQPYQSNVQTMCWVRGVADDQTHHNTSSRQVPSSSSMSARKRRKRRSIVKNTKTGLSGQCNDIIECC